MADQAGSPKKLTLALPGGGSVVDGDNVWCMRDNGRNTEESAAMISASSAKYRNTGQYLCLCSRISSCDPPNLTHTRTVWHLKPRAGDTSSRWVEIRADDGRGMAKQALSIPRSNAIICLISIRQVVR